MKYYIITIDICIFDTYTVTISSFKLNENVTFVKMFFTDDYKRCLKNKIYGINNIILINNITNYHAYNKKKIERRKTNNGYTLEPINGRILSINGGIINLE